MNEVFFWCDSFLFEFLLKVFDVELLFHVFEICHFLVEEHELDANEVCGVDEEDEVEDDLDKENGDAHGKQENAWGRIVEGALENHFDEALEGSEQAEETQGEQQAEEESVVPTADACVQPVAVVVEHVHTSVAFETVLCSLPNLRFTHMTKVIKLSIIIPRNLSCFDHLQPFPSFFFQY